MNFKKKNEYMPKKSVLTNNLTQVACLAVRYTNPYTRMFSVLSEAAMKS